MEEIGGTIGSMGEAFETSFDGRQLLGAYSKTLGSLLDNKNFFLLVVESFFCSWVAFLKL